MPITYSVAECETEIALIDAQIKEIRGLPSKGTIGKDMIDLTGTMANLRSERETWVQRLQIAYAGNVPRRARRFI